MAYSEYLQERISTYLDQKGVDFEAKKMMGGLTFMVRSKMCVGIVGDDLMARIGQDPYEEALRQEGVRKMDFTGRPMKGYVFISPEVIDSEDQLAYWINLALTFNTTL